MESPGQDLPVLNDGAWQDLKDDVGEIVARAYVREYLEMLPFRAAKIFDVLTEGVSAESLDAVVSLRTSSAMAGALRLESYCRDLEIRLKHGQSPDVPAVKAAVFAHMGQIAREASSRGYLSSTSS